MSDSGRGSGWHLTTEFITEYEAYSCVFLRPQERVLSLFPSPLSSINVYGHSLKVYVRQKANGVRLSTATLHRSSVAHMDSGMLPMYIHISISSAALTLVSFTVPSLELLEPHRRVRVDAHVAESLYHCRDDMGN